MYQIFSTGYFMPKCKIMYCELDTFRTPVCRYPTGVFQEHSIRHINCAVSTSLSTLESIYSHSCFVSLILTLICATLMFCVADTLICATLMFCVADTYADMCYTHVLCR
jgi:hypothetical protein